MSYSRLSSGAPDLDLDLDTKQTVIKHENNRRYNIAKNRAFEGFLQFMNNSNILSTAVEFMKSPAQAFASLWFVKYINAPLAIVANVFLTINAIRKAAIKKDGFSIANAVVVAGTSAAMIVAGIAIAASIAVLSAVTPILIAASFGVKALWDLGTAFVYGIKAATTKETDLKRLYKNRALNALVDGVVGGLVTAAVVAVYMVAAPIVQTILTGFAIAAGSIGILAAIVKLGTAGSHASIEDRGLEALATAKKKASSTSSMARKMNHNRGNQVDLTAGLEKPRRDEITPLVPQYTSNVEQIDEDQKSGMVMGMGGNTY